MIANGPRPPSSAAPAGGWTATRVLAAILVVNAAVAAARVLYGLAVGSLAIYGDGLHAATDGLNNVVGLAVLRIAHRPADHEHPYGHQRYEILAAAAVGVVLLLLASELYGRAISAFDQELAVPAVAAGGWVLLGSTLVVNVGVAWWERRMGRRLRSALLVADANHTAADVVLTIGVIVTTLFASRGVPVLDVLAAILLGTVVAAAGVKLLWESAQTLADRAALAPDEIRAVARAVDGVIAVPQVRSRGGPGAVHVDLIVHLPGDLSFDRAHAISDRVADAIEQSLDDVVDVVVHAEPAPSASRSPTTEDAPAHDAPSPPRAVA